MDVFISTRNHNSYFKKKKNSIFSNKLNTFTFAPCLCHVPTQRSVLLLHTILKGLLILAWKGWLCSPWPPSEIWFGTRFHHLTYGFSSKLLSRYPWPYQKIQGQHDTWSWSKWIWDTCRYTWENSSEQNDVRNETAFDQDEQGKNDRERSIDG